MKHKLCQLWDSDDSEECTIFRAPNNVQKSMKNMFEPSVVSIGPYHRGRPHLRLMEEKKWQFLMDFLDHGECRLETCISKIREVEKRARRCYSETFIMNSDEFVEMMILDGCFIVEFFHKYIIQRDLKSISEGWISLIVENDLILLENQIPFFIIEIFLAFLGNPFDFADIARKLTRQKIPIRAPSQQQKIHHLLHLCHCYAVHSPLNSMNIAASQQKFTPYLDWIWEITHIPLMKNLWLQKEEKQEEITRLTIPCATELKEAGVKLKSLEQSDDLTKITFKSGTLSIPRLRIDDSIRPLFMNLVAWEQSMSSQVPSQFSTYMMFMDKLVNTTDDLKVLQRKGILENMLSSEESVALFFNQTGPSVYVPENHYLAEQFKEVNRYCKSSYHKHRAKLCHDYFRSPWTIISLMAGVILLLLTIVQATMAVYSYKQAEYFYKHPKP